MKVKTIWKFPVPSTNLEGDAILFFPGGDAWLLFAYSDSKKNHQIFNSGIKFDTVFAHKHTSENFVSTLYEAYDNIVEIIDSNWIEEYKNKDKRLNDLFNLKHYAIFLDSNGLYEFIACNFFILETNLGHISNIFPDGWDS